MRFHADFPLAVKVTRRNKNFAFRLVQVHQGWPRPESVEPRFGRLVRLFAEKFDEVDQ